MNTKDVAILVSITVLVISATFIVGVEGLSSSTGLDRSRSLQQLTGGLGFGASLHIADCAFAFDPRLQRQCGLDHGAIPGGTCFCPHHADSIFYFAPLESGNAMTAREALHATPP